MSKVIVLLGKNGDIAMVANRYVTMYGPTQKEKPVWVVNYKFAAILEELYSEWFEIDKVDIAANEPLTAKKYAERRYFDSIVGVVQQNGADDELEQTRTYRNYQQYQLAQLDKLFQ